MKNIRQAAITVLFAGMALSSAGVASAGQTTVDITPPPVGPRPPVIQKLDCGGTTGSWGCGPGFQHMDGWRGWGCYPC